MAKSLVELLAQREHVKKEEEDLTEQIIETTERYVLSAIHLGCKILSTQDMSQTAIIDSVRNLYDNRLVERDITASLKRLTIDGKLKEHISTHPHPNSYSINPIEGGFGDIPVIEYLPKKEPGASTSKDSDENIPF